MIQPNDEATIKALVVKLFRAENRKYEPGNQDASAQNRQGNQDAANILAETDYLPIIRAKGQVDESREDTLKKMSKGSHLFVRHVDLAIIEVALYLENRVAIARSLLPTTDAREAPPVEASYRNTHVFLKRNDEWKCVAWQVTKVQ